MSIDEWKFHKNEDGVEYWYHPVTHEVSRHKPSEQPDDCRAAFEKWFEALLLMNRGKITLLSKDFAWGVWEPAWNARTPLKREISKDNDESHATVDEL